MEHGAKPHGSAFWFGHFLVPLASDFTSLSLIFSAWKMGVVKAPTHRVGAQMGGVNVFKVLRIKAGVQDTLGKF